MAFRTTDVVTKVRLRKAALRTKNNKKKSLLKNRQKVLFRYAIDIATNFGDEISDDKINYDV